ETGPGIVALIQENGGYAGIESAVIENPWLAGGEGVGHGWMRDEIPREVEGRNSEILGAEIELRPVQIVGRHVQPGGKGRIDASRKIEQIVGKRDCGGGQVHALRGLD